MSIQYKDYYKILGIERSATPDEIKKAFRKLAGKHHPDRNPGDKKAEEHFKEINEANEVLSDPEKRRRYDTLGSGFHQGQAFDPRDFAGAFGAGGGRGRGGVRMETMNGGAFSDFFEALFGGVRSGASGRPDEGFDPFGSSGGRGERFGGGFGHERTGGGGADVEAGLTISLEEAYRGGTRRVSFNRTTTANNETTLQHYDVKIPPGIREGQKIRLKGQGGAHGSHSGDILIRIKIAPHPRYRLDDDKLEADLPLTPWEAALGGSVSVNTLEGSVDVKVPPGIQSGKRLRVRGYGWPIRDGGKGDLYLRVNIMIPEKLTGQEHELFEKLAKISRFNPRT